MRVREPWRRLGTLWGRVDEQHSRLILRHLRGKRILAVGCGYGSFVHFMNRQDGYYVVGDEVVGVDVDGDALEIARRLHPGSKYVVCDRKKLEFPDGFFDTVVFKETLHHVFGEQDADSFMREVSRVLKNDGGRIVVFDPNPNLLLRTARILAFHRDPECSLSDAVSLLNRSGFEVKKVAFFELLALPLSGGYVGVNFVPNIHCIQRAVLYLNERLSRLAHRLGLGRRLLWRYLLVAERRGEVR